MENKTWAFAVPYRYRAHHLDVFVGHYSRLFPGIPIYIIEQFDDKPFNRAGLFNIFFAEVGHMMDYACYCDIDMFCRKGTDYSYPEAPIGLATRASQFGYKMPYPTYYGGVTLLSKEHMLKVDGFSNKFYSRGGEDDEMYNELKKHGLNPQWREGWFECFDHPRPNDPKLYPTNLKLLKQGRGKDDGLSSLKYGVYGTETHKDYTLIKVSLEE